MKVQKLQVLECPVPGCGDEILWPEDWLMLSWVNPEQFAMVNEAMELHMQVHAEESS